MQEYATKAIILMSECKSEIVVIADKAVLHMMQIGGVYT